MKRELLIALAVSLAIHGGLALGGQFFKDSPPPPKPPEEIPTMELVALPPVEPEVIEQTEPTNDAPSEVADLAPPMQNDLPSAVLDSPFVQQIQPPPPPGFSRPTGTITIPAGRPASGTGQSLSNIFNLSELDQVPVITLRVPPVYPYELKRSGIQGEVMIQFIIDTEGNVKDPQVVSSSRREFEEEALKAISKWKFKPGRRGGVVVNTRRNQPFNFSLSN